MKKIIILALLFVFAITTIVPEAFGQTRRKKKFRGLATNAAIVGGSTLAGALIGRGKGAMIGAGAGLLYASSRSGTKRDYRHSKYRRAAKIAGGGLLGAGAGGFIAGRTGMIVGGLAGAGATYLFTRNGRRYYTASNGRRFYVQNGRRYYTN